MFSRSNNGEASRMISQARRLRVALIASSLRLAGAEKQTFYMARALHRAGAETRLFHLGGGGYYEPVLRQSGVPVNQIYTPNKPCPMLARLMGALWQWKPQIVLAAQFGDLLYGAPAGRLCHALVLGGIRSDGFYELNAHGRFSRWMVRLAHGLIANSCRARQNLVSRGIKREKIAVLPNVIDLRDFDGRSGLSPGISLPSDRIIAAAVGSLHPCKRFDRFIEALALARRTEPALAGVIAGKDGGAKAELQAKANALGFGPRDLTFLGEVGNVPALLARSALLALTSDYEGFPNVILEAMAARLPVISVPAGDAGLIVQHGTTGFVVEPEDVRGMAALMVQLAQSPWMRRSFGEAGRKRVEQEYDETGLAERLPALFHGFASQCRRHALCELLERGEVAANPELRNSKPQVPSPKETPTTRLQSRDFLLKLEV
ncbi:MAG: glycosyltransferase family 4 protein [Verrucomicrobiota bacterium]|nr:glycosyltransferase family 4 protein [Verrucomicrobiota bacterium]